MLAALEDALSDVESLGKLDQEAWARVFEDVVYPLVSNMRDVRRYAVGVRATASGLGGAVQLADILGLEAIRTFLPNVFRGLRPISGVLTHDRGRELDVDLRTEEGRKTLEALIEAGGEMANVVIAMLSTHFPATGRYHGKMTYGPDWHKQWPKERRVAHPLVLSLYLER